jgi:glycosyltransferase involved in cell wall biosynthesis
MACGCVPVVTDRGALPEVVGDAGIYVPYGEEEATAEGITEALQIQRVSGNQARRRIVEGLALAHREKRLLSVISGGGRAT